MGARRGFSLVEAIIAMTISTLLVVAIGNVFIVQSQFYARLSGGAASHDNARAVVQAIQPQAASMVSGGLVVADSLNLVMRLPQTLASVCALQGSNAHSLLAAGDGSIDEDATAGMAKLSLSTGIWTFAPGSVNSVTGPTGGTPATRCVANGTDTVGARDDFMRLNGLSGWFGTAPLVGDVYMFYEEVEFEFGTSTLDPAVWALYRGGYGETLPEFVSGLGSTSYFSYRVGSTWSTSPSVLSSVDAIRIHATARAPAESGGAQDATYELVVVVPLRNAS